MGLDGLEKRARSVNSAFGPGGELAVRADVVLSLIEAARELEQANGAIQFLNEEGWASGRYRALREHLRTGDRGWLTVQECVEWAKRLGWEPSAKEPTNGR